MKYFFLVLVLLPISVKAQFSPEKGWTLISKESKDLNADQKTDDIFWLTQSKARHGQPERAVIVVNGKVVLDYKDKFCGPSGQNGYGNADDCKALKILTDKNQLTIVDQESSSSDQQVTQSHRYDWNGQGYVLTSANFTRKTTGQMQETDVEVIDLDYKTGWGTRSAWIEYGVQKTIKEKRRERCRLENTRASEALQQYNGFNVSNEFKCKG